MHFTTPSTASAAIIHNYSTRLQHRLLFLRMYVQEERVPSSDEPIKLSIKCCVHKQSCALLLSGSPSCDQWICLPMLLQSNLALIFELILFTTDLLALLSLAIPASRVVHTPSSSPSCFLPLLRYNLQLVYHISCSLV